MITRGFGMAMDLERVTMRYWVMGIDGSRQWIDDIGEQRYQRIRPIPSLLVTATYQHTGKIPPRKFTDDDEVYG